MLNPATPVGALEEIAGDVDFVLVMSVNPGFGGQTFIPRSESKVRAVRRCSIARAAARRSKSTAASTRARAARVVAAGARILVAGAAIFTHPDPEAGHARPPGGGRSPG